MINFILILSLIAIPQITFTINNNTVMVFGCFDLLHEGHKQFLKQSATHGKIIAVVTRDNIIKTLKKHYPVQSEEIRLQQMQMLPYIFHATLGDETLGKYGVIKEYKPNLICLGYDQQGLFEDLQIRMNNQQLPQIPLLILEPYREDIYHTSLIRKNMG